METPKELNIELKQRDGLPSQYDVLIEGKREGMIKVENKVLTAYNAENGRVFLKHIGNDPTKWQKAADQGVRSVLNDYLSRNEQQAG